MVLLWNLDWEHMKIDHDHIMLNANAQMRRSKIYKIVTN